MQTVELKVRMDCDGCELKVKKAISSMKGIELKTLYEVYINFTFEVIKQYLE